MGREFFFGAPHFLDGARLMVNHGAVTGRNGFSDAVADIQLLREYQKFF
jgi:hypothetical protein